MTDEGDHPEVHLLSTGGHGGPPLRRVTMAFVGADLCVRPHDDHYTHDSHPHPALRATFPLGGGRLGIVSLRGAKRRGDPSPKIVLTNLVYSDKLGLEERFIAIN